MGLLTSQLFSVFDERKALGFALEQLVGTAFYTDLAA
jgi:hypothetical protein